MQHDMNSQEDEYSKIINDQKMKLFSIVCVVSWVSWNKLKVLLGVLILLLMSDVGSSPHTLIVGGRWQSRIHLELIQSRRSTRGGRRLHCIIISYLRNQRRCYKCWNVFLQRNGANDDGNADQEVKGWTRWFHYKVQPVLDINDAAASIFVQIASIYLLVAITADIGPDLQHKQHSLL